MPHLFAVLARQVLSAPVDDRGRAHVGLVGGHLPGGVQPVRQAVLETLMKRHRQRKRRVLLDTQRVDHPPVPRRGRAAIRIESKTNTQVRRGFPLGQVEDLLGPVGSGPLHDPVDARPATAVGGNLHTGLVTRTDFVAVTKSQDRPTRPAQIDGGEYPAVHRGRIQVARRIAQAGAALVGAVRIHAPVPGHVPVVHGFHGVAKSKGDRHGCGSTLRTGRIRVVRVHHKQAVVVGLPDTQACVGERVGADIRELPKEKVVEIDIGAGVTSQLVALKCRAQCRRVPVQVDRLEVWNGSVQAGIRRALLQRNLVDVDVDVGGVAVTGDPETHAHALPRVGRQVALDTRPVRIEVHVQIGFGALRPGQTVVVGDVDAEVPVACAQNVPLDPERQLGVGHAREVQRAAQRQAMPHLFAVLARQVLSAPVDDRGRAHVGLVGGHLPGGVQPVRQAVLETLMKRHRQRKRRVLLDTQRVDHPPVPRRGRAAIRIESKTNTQVRRGFPLGQVEDLLGPVGSGPLHDPVDARPATAVGGDLHAGFVAGCYVIAVPKSQDGPA